MLECANQKPEKEEYKSASPTDGLAANRDIEQTGR